MKLHTLGSLFNTKNFDLYQLLISFNFLVLLLILSTLSIPSSAGFFDIQAIYYDGSVSFIDRTSVFLAVILSVMVHFSLIRAKEYSNIFVFILNYYFITYYLLRFATLSLTGYSSIFDSYLEPPDLYTFNITLSFLILANSAIYLGFGLFSRKIFSINIDRSFNPPPSFLNLLLGAFFIAICLEGTNSLGFILSYLPHHANFLILFVSPILFLFIGLITFVVYHRNISRTYCSLFILISLLYLALSISGGGKSIIIFIVETTFIILAAIKITITRKEVVKMILIIPIFITLLYFIFALAVDIRAAKVSISPDDTRSFRELAIENFFKRGFQSSDSIIPSIFNRVGYLDVIVNINKNQKEYSKHLNLKTLKNSFVDNILTPGFDVYDQPKHANSLVFVYKNINEGKISKKFVSDGTAYQSDIFTIYGELFLYFSWFSLLFLSLWAFVGLNLMNYLTIVNNKYLSTALKISLLLFVGRSYQSMGMDWVLHEIIPFLAIVYIFGFVAARVKKYD